MSDFVSILIALGFFILFLLLFPWRRQPRSSPGEDQSRLLGWHTRVVGAEVSVSVTDMVRFSTWIEEVWESSSGLLVPVERKTRDWVSASDRIQLSAAAYILRKSHFGVGSGNFASYGIVRLSPPDRSDRLVTVPLLKDSDIEYLISRYVGLRYGLFPPSPEPSPSKCAACGFSHRRCPHSAA